MTHYGMVIDTTRCVGCNACSVACKMANDIPEGIWWTRVLTDGGDAVDTPGGTYPNTHMRYITLSCQHCENPACTRACPVGATFKDTETGIVRQDYDICIGCRMCIAACPYTGVRSFNWDEPTYPADLETGDADIAHHQKHTVEKCTFCYQRMARGETPACMDLCPARARHFGDFDDPDSEVSQLIATHAYERLLEDVGTEPSCYYLV